MPDSPKPIGKPNPAKRFDMNALRRLCFWGGAASIALAVVAVTTQTNIGAHRLQVALSDVRESSDVFAAVAPVPAPTLGRDGNQKLAETVRSLTTDRDRLAARIASLERDLNEVTGSIAKHTETQAAVKLDPAASPLPPALAAAPATVPAASVASAPEPSPPIGNSATPGAAVPLPPLRANETPGTAASARLENAPAPTRTEFGIDLGGAPSIAALRRHWSALKAAHGPLLAGLSPLVAARERAPGTVDYRLVVGPFGNAAAAAGLCARLAAARLYCRTAEYGGQHFALR